ncbi:MAG TPA: YciI family protein [Thermoanaerobaculia bacterium]|nr:YciI family protein [Thermoanaerobaculia bacterium]
MKYLLLAYHDETKWDALSDDEKDAIGSQCLPYDEELRQGGHVIAMGSLEHTRMSTVMRTRSGRLLTTDGPFIETKEQLGGFLIIEARDLNEALQVAANHPAARMNERLGWCVEVRPFEFFEQP